MRIKWRSAEMPPVAARAGLGGRKKTANEAVPVVRSPRVSKQSGVFLARAELALLVGSKLGMHRLTETYMAAH